MLSRTWQEINAVTMKMNIPNALTVSRIILTPVFYYLIIQPEPDLKIAASILFLIASITDWYDGYIARRFNMTSRWGQFMDPLADKFLVSTALAVFAYLNYVYWWMVLIVIIRDFTITFLRSFAEYIGRPIITSSLAKWKTAFQMTFVFALLLYMNIPVFPEVRLNLVQSPWMQWTTILFSIVVLLTAISGIQYLIGNRAHFGELIRRLFRRIS